MSNIRYEYMTAYIESAKQVGRLENAIGWYHSHPGKVAWIVALNCYVLLVQVTVAGCLG